VVPHRGTNWAALWLTAQIGRDAVLSESYGRGWCEVPSIPHNPRVGRARASARGVPGGAGSAGACGGEGGKGKREGRGGREGKGEKEKKKKKKEEDSSRLWFPLDVRPPSGAKSKRPALKCGRRKRKEKEEKSPTTNSVEQIFGTRA
jgi:hypothetical protein